MQPADRLGPYSLRRMLEAASWGGLITTAVLTGLLLYIAWTASSVLQAARNTHERVQVYTQLDRIIYDLQVAKYQQLRRAGPQADRTAAIQTARMRQLLAQAQALPAETDHDRAVARQVAREGAAVEAYFNDLPRLMRGVDAKMEQGGARAAMREIRRVSSSVSALNRTLSTEIRAGDSRVTQRTANAHRLIGQAVAASLIGLLLAIGLSCAVYVLLHKRLRPGLMGLERGVESFANGNLDYRINPSGSDELGRLATAFNLMAEALDEKQRTLTEARLNLEHQVAVRTEQLQKANAELSGADERRRAFLADVSHELRTPLTIIRGEADVALRTAEHPDFDANEAFERILKQTRDLSRMVDDLFVIALAESGALPLERQVLDLHEVASRVADDFGTLASEAGGSVRVISGPRYFASIDPERVRRAIAALVENAMRHCQPAVNVVIEVSMHDGRPIIAVTDDGPGLDFSIASQLFERFRRGDTRGEGSGLGLSLVSALMEAHGGRAYLVAGASGGTRAVLEFPAETFAKVAC